ncbi:MAG: ABC transporter ATP-binding protein [Atopobiaceae bacterium]|jgi:ATP-binding cassette subfamily B protein|nr:ABC transporter ATP-binding protein/permease [Atopobiaceae bacterium]
MAEKGQGSPARRRKPTRSYSANLRSLLSYVDGTWHVWVAITVLAIGNLLLSFAPRLAGQVTDYLSEYAQNRTAGLDPQRLVGMLVLLAGLYVAGNLLTIVTSKMMMKVSRTVTYRLRRDLQDKLERLSIGYLDTHSAGNIMSRVTNDITTVENLVENSIVNFLVQMTIIVLVFVMMVVIEPRLALVYVAIVPLAFLIMKLITGRTRTEFKRQQNSIGLLNGYVGDIVENHMLVKAYGMEDASKEHFKELNKVSFDAYMKSRFFSGFIIPINTMLNNLGFILVALFGGIMIVQGVLTVGEFLAFLLYGQMLNGPMTSISNSMNNIQSGFSAFERVTDLLDEPDVVDGDDVIALDVAKVEGRIDFSHVRFGYVPGKTLFHDVSFSAEPSSLIAIVGPSGAGKTTLINLLMRFYDIDGGTISLDGTDITSYGRAELRRAFGMVLQDSWVFEGTIAENIGYGADDPTKDDIRKAAEMVGCDSFINTLPQGYDTRVSEECMPLSVGEKQLLVLARTVISDPKIMILDEATSQMDTRTEALVTKAMERMMRGRTTFVIAHRLFTIKNADKIVFMKDGDVREVGSHEELMAKNGLYAEMYRSL